MADTPSLEQVAATAAAIARDYGRNTADDRRQIRRLANLVAILATHATKHGRT